jgi:adenine phosphoribosyltransferase
LSDVKAFRYSVDALADHFAGNRVDKVLGIEARGFIVAAPVAYRFGAGFVPVRKKGKLPWTVEAQEYVLEYGTDSLEIHRDALGPGDHALIIDDVLATGGTAAAATRLVERLGGVTIGAGFLIELTFLGGRGKLGGYDVVSLITYD